MAVIDWPAAFGYAEFSEQPHRSRGPYVHRSVFTGAVHVSYGGGSRRRGYVVTPVSTATGAVQPAITALVQQLSDPANQLRLHRPGAAAAGPQMTANVTRIQPPERDERGVWRGWRLEFVEIGTAADPLPGLLEESMSDLPIRETGDIAGASDTDRYEWELKMATNVLVTLTGLADGSAGDIGFRVFNEDGETTAIHNLTSSGVGRSDSATLPAGNYYVVVGTNTDDDTDTPYDLHVYAPDYSPSLPLSESSSNNIVGNSELDIYPFSLQAETNVLVTLTGLADGRAGDIGLRVFNEDGGTTEIANSTAAGGGHSDSATLPAGNYYVVVGTNTDDDTDTPYDLHVYAPDYSPSLPLSESSSNNIVNSDLDIYPFSLQAETNVLVTLTGLADGRAGDIGFRVFNEDGGTTAIGNSTFAGADHSDSATLPAGNYYVVVGTDTDDDTDTPYELSVAAQ